MRCRLVAAIVLVLCASPAFAAMQAKPVTWKIGKESFTGMLVYDDANAIKRPGLVMVPNWKGVSPAAIERAKHIAGDDYVVLVAGTRSRSRASARGTSWSRRSRTRPP